MAGEFAYNVDIVLCIDGTQDMEPFIEGVKNSAKIFHEKLAEGMSKRLMDITTLRVKVIVFRDYFHDGDKSMEISDFFTLPGQTNNFNNFVSSIKAYGGGDGPDSGLEAIAHAVKSDWNTGGERKRHVIVVWTNASAHRFEEAQGEKRPANYPSDMPKTLEDLAYMWHETGAGSLNKFGKRLVIYAPDVYPWNVIGTEWENACWWTSKAGECITEIDMEMLLGPIKCVV